MSFIVAGISAATLDSVGTLTVNKAFINTNATCSSITNFGDVGTGSVTASGTITGASLVSTGGVSSNTLTCSGAGSVGGQLTAGGNVSVSGTLTALNNASVGGTLNAVNITATGDITCDNLLSTNPCIAFFLTTATFQAPANSSTYLATMGAYTNIINRGGMTFTSGATTITKTGVYQISATWFISGQTTSCLPTDYWTGLSTAGGATIRRCRGNNVNFQATLSAGQSYTFFIVNNTASVITLSTGGSTGAPNNYFSVSLLT